MSGSEIFSSVVTGVISSILVLMALELRDQRKWTRTKRLFLSKMHGQILLANYEILVAFDINPAYDDVDRAKPISEIEKEILSADISLKKYASLARHFNLIRDNIESIRSQALAISTFNPKDFHSVDKSLTMLGTYTSAHYFSQLLDENEDEREALEQNLKKKLADIYVYIRNE